MTTLIPVPADMRGYIVRVDPTDPRTADDIDYPQPDWSMWFIEASISDRRGGGQAGDQ